MLEIIWNKSIEPGVKTEIERHLTPYLWLVPGWVQAVRVSVDTSDNGDLLATCTVNEKYREVALSVKPFWLTGTDRDKTETLIHELIHIYTNPLYDYSINAVKRYARGEEIDPERQIIFDEMDCYLERATQDLAYVIFRKMNPIA